MYVVGTESISLSCFEVTKILPLFGWKNNNTSYLRQWLRLLHSPLTLFTWSIKRPINAVNPLTTLTPSTIPDGMYISIWSLGTTGTLPVPSETTHPRGRTFSCSFWKYTCFNPIFPFLDTCLLLSHPLMRFGSLYCKQYGHRLGWALT